jgi:hypothetical protein
MKMTLINRSDRQRLEREAMQETVLRAIRNMSRRSRKPAGGPRNALHRI